MFEIIDELLKKKYEIPLNIPEKQASKYMEIICRDYAKYLEVIYNCGSFCMFKQFYNLELLFKNEFLLSDGLKNYSRKKIHKMEKLGFIKVSSFNNNKFIYLRKPAMALIQGDYKKISKINLLTNLKASKFESNILKTDYFLEYGKYLSHKNPFIQLKLITKTILTEILKTNNKFGYDINLIKRILKLENYNHILNLIEGNPEHKSKLDLVRILWKDIALIYKKLVMQGQTISEEPFHLKLKTLSNGKIIIHYAPEIVILDVLHDKEYYNDYIQRMLIKYNKIIENDIMYVFDYFNEKGILGKPLSHVFCYSLCIIGSNKESLQQKFNLIENKMKSEKSNSKPLLSVRQILLKENNYLEKTSYKGDYNDTFNKKLNKFILSNLYH